MLYSSTQLIDPVRWANQGVAIKGGYSLATLDRLVPLLHTSEGEVTFALSFECNEEGRRVVRGQIAAKLVLLCQRCLAPMIFSVDRVVSLCVAEDLAAVDRLPNTCEPLLLEKGLVSVHTLVEDELILDLPVVALHDLTQCPAQTLIERYGCVQD